MKKTIAINTTMMDGRKAKGTATVIRMHIEELLKCRDKFEITLVHKESADNRDLYSHFSELIIPNLWKYKFGGFINELFFFLNQKYIKKFNPDIYFHFYNRLLPSFIFAPGKKFFFHAMDGGPKTSGYTGEARDPFPWWVKIFKGRIDKYIGLSRFGASGIKEVLDLPENKVAFAYNGLDDLYFNFSKNKEKVERSLKKHSIENKYILCVSRFDPHKNILNLLEAYKKYLETNSKKLDLVFVGGAHMPEYSQKVFDFIKQNSLEQKIRILKYVEFEDLPNIYSGAEFLIYPSFYEGFGLPILEANATGCAVVCSRIPALVEVGGDSVLTFDPYNVDSITESILKIDEDLDLRKELVSRGTLNYKKYTWNKASEQLVKIFQED